MSRLYESVVMTLSPPEVLTLDEALGHLKENTRPHQHEQINATMETIITAATAIKAHEQIDFGSDELESEQVFFAMMALTVAMNVGEKSGEDVSQFEGLASSIDGMAAHYKDAVKRRN